jgi:hypothetical protein
VITNLELYWKLLILGKSMLFVLNNEKAQHICRTLKVIFLFNLRRRAIMYLEFSDILL